MELQEFLDYMNSGKTVIAHSDIHRYMSELALEALRLTAELNGSYHTPEEIISIFEQLTGKPVDSSLKIFPPFYTDCGKNLTVGKNVFFNSGCKVQDQGGITIGDGTLIGHNVVLATLNHEFEPSRRADMRPRPIKIGCNVWIGSNATILPGVPLFFNRFGGVPQGIPVCVLWWGMGRQHDFGVDDFAFMGIVFLFLVVFGKQPFPALVGGGSDGRLAFAALNDFQVKVRAWWHDGLWPPFSRRPGKEKAGNRSMISCLVVPPVGGWYSVFDFMMVETIHRL